MTSNDGGKRVVYLDADLYEYAVRHLEESVTVGLLVLNQMNVSGKLSRENAEQMVADVEQMRRLRAAFEEAK